VMFIGAVGWGINEVSDLCARSRCGRWMSTKSNLTFSLKSLCGCALHGGCLDCSASCQMSWRGKLSINYLEW
jgi:hypothetical protein